MKSFFVLGLLFCSVGLFAQNGRILVANHSFSKQEGVERAFHTPTYYEGNPVLKADKKWVLGATGDPYAAPFSAVCGMMRLRVNIRCGILPEVERNTG